MGSIVDAFGGLQQELNWLLTGDEQFIVNGKPTWLSGRELTRRVEDQKPAYSWAVLSGFAPDIVVDLSETRLPYADGNRALWIPYPEPQHPLALLEIVIFDASLTILLSREPEFTRRFRAHFSDALDLNGYIDRHIRPVLRAWAATAQSFPVGAVATVPVSRVSQTTARVEFPTGVAATLQVKQMRATGFGPAHWFALDELLKVGQQLVVRVVDVNEANQRLEVEFLQVAP